MADGLAARLRLVLVTPGDAPPSDTAALVGAALEGGVTAVLLRERQLPDAERRALYAELVERCRAAGALSLVSREAELAAALGADGVHLGWGGPDVAAARAALPGGLVGRSAHWPLEEEDGRADYLTLSPFAATPRSRPRPLLTGEQVAAALAAAGERPVVALGGLDAARVPDLPDGLAGVAVVRALADAGDPRGAAAVLRSAVDAWLAFGSSGAEAWT